MWQAPSWTKGKDSREAFVEIFTSRLEKDRVLEGIVLECRMPTLIHISPTKDPFPSPLILIHRANQTSNSGHLPLEPPYHVPTGKRHEVTEKIHSVEHEPPLSYY